MFRRVLPWLTVCMVLSRLMAQASAADFTYVGADQLSLSQWAALVPGHRTLNEGEIEITARASQPLVCDYPCALAPGTEYLFRAKVKSSGAVVFDLTGLAMSYNALGDWQTIAGLCRATAGAQPKLRFTLRSLDGHPASVRIASLSLIQVKRPAWLPRRAASAATPWVQAGQPIAAIVVPAGDPEYLSLAQDINGEVHRVSGRDLPIVTDAVVTENDYPVLRAEWRSRPLIVLGRLGNNRALWCTYTRSLTAVDGYYPGADGFVLQTAADVFDTGVNHVIVGGSTTAGVRRAVARLLARLRELPRNASSLELPWLHEVEVRSECREMFLADDARWSESPDSPRLAKPEPGYGNVIRWYQNAMGFVFTGWESYRRRAAADLRQILQERAGTHHYIQEFMVRTYRMLDRSGELSAEEVQEMDALILSNFLDCGTVTDLTWMTTFSPPYGNIPLVNRHQISTWLADLTLAEFIIHRLQPSGGLATLVEFRRDEKLRLFTDFVTHRSGPSLPGGVADECYDEIPAAFFRFALDHDQYRAFFGSHQADRALSLERINPQSGALAYPSGHRDLKFLLGIMASLTRDPGYMWLWRHLPDPMAARGYFQGRYLGSVLRYNPDADTPDAISDLATHLRFAPPPVDAAPSPLALGRYQFAAILGGWKRTDDYVCFNGLDYLAPSGLVPTLAAQGVTWLSGDKFGDTSSRFNLNTAYAIRTDAPAIARHFDDASYCLEKCDSPSRATVRFRQQLSPEIEWTRDVLWQAPGCFVFRDQFTARETGTYSLGVAWRPAGLAVQRGGDFMFRADGATLRLTALGAGFETELWPPESASDRSAVRCHTVRTLRAGESVISWTVLQAGQAGQREPAGVRLIDEERLVFEGRKQDAALAWPFDTATSTTTPDRGTQPHPPFPVRNRQTDWVEAWRSDALLRPAPVEGISHDGVTDFGRVVHLREIRAPEDTRPRWQRSRLPGMLEVAEQPGGWHKADGLRTLRASVRAGNYGETTPVADAGETLDLASVPVRYVRGNAATSLKFFSDDTRASRHPVRLECGDFLGDGTTLTLAVAQVFPQFLRAWSDDDVSLTLLDQTGHARFTLDAHEPVQAVRLLPWKNPPALQLFVVYASGRIDVYDLNGNRMASADLRALHSDFDRRYSHHATRQPAGGFAMPFSIGLGRPDPAGGRKLVVGRYGGFSFLRSDLSLEGVLNIPGYAVPGLLACGADFSFTGAEEQLGAERQRFWQIGGSDLPRVRDAGGAQYWPQVYDLLKSVPEASGAQLPLAGPSIVRYEILSGVSPSPRYVLLARGTTLSIYDARRHEIAASWSSPAPITGTGIVVSSDGRLELLVSTADRLLWHLCWASGFNAPPEANAEEFPDVLRSVREAPNAAGRAVLGGAHGLYLWSDHGWAERIADGDFVDARPFSVTLCEISGVVASTRQGEIVAWHRRKRD